MGRQKALSKRVVLLSCVALAGGCGDASPDDEAPPAVPVPDAGSEPSPEPSDGGGGGEGIPPRSDAQEDPPPDAGAPGECPCFDGPGTYCADRVTDYAAANGCTAKKAEKHAGDVLSCHAGTWRWDATCDGACKQPGGGADACANVVYQLPWKCGSKKTCSAGNGAAGHHEVGSTSEFAFDFIFSLDSKVRAARGGRVKVLKFDTGPGDPCYDGCDGPKSVCSPKCGDKANVLTVRHADGTVGEYVHLNGPAPGIVKDAWVEQGEVIALSGSTGWSTGPHLHFMVMEKGCTLLGCQSIPIEFLDVGVAKADKAYESQNCP